MNSMFMIVMMLSGTFLQQPPADLMSMLDMETAMKELALDGDEDSLLLLATGVTADQPSPEQLKQAAADLGDSNFRTRKAAAKLLKSGGESAVPTLRGLLKSEDPEVSVTARKLLKEMAEERRKAEANDTAYATRLVAINRLGETKSKKAEAALAELASGGDFGVRLAARAALHKIRGTKPERPTGLETLEQTLPYLPSNPGFVGMLDLERESAALPLLKMMKKGGQPQKMQMLMGGGRGLPDDQMNAGLLKALNTVGNVRIDSITFVVSEDLAEHGGHVAAVFKGLYDVNRWDRLMQEEMRADRVVKDGKPIFFDRNDPSFCLVDSNTLVFAAGPEWKDSANFLRVLSQIGTKKEPAEVGLKAFEEMKAGGQRLTAAGSFSKVQREFFGAILKEEVDQLKARKRPNMEVPLLFLQFLQGVINVDDMRGGLSDAGRLAIRGTCKDLKQAQALSTKSTELHDGLRGMMMKNMDGAPPDFKKMIDDLGEDPFWKSEVKGSEIRMDASAEVVGQVPMLLMFGARPRAVPVDRVAPAPKVVPAPKAVPLEKPAVPAP